MHIKYLTTYLLARTLHLQTGLPPTGLRRIRESAESTSSLKTRQWAPPVLQMIMMSQETLPAPGPMCAFVVWERDFTHSYGGGGARPEPNLPA